MAQVVIQGIFGHRFLKKNFILNLKEEASLQRVFEEIDNHLKIRYFKKNLNRLPDGAIILLNGQTVNSPLKEDIFVKDSDTLSILRVFAGG